MVECMNQAHGHSLQSTCSSTCVIMTFVTAETRISKKRVVSHQFCRSIGVNSAVWIENSVQDAIKL